MSEFEFDGCDIEEPKDVPRYELGKLGRWNLKRGKDYEWETVCIADVPVDILLGKWEQLIVELSEKEVRLVHLKEYIQSQSFHLETTVDFKEIYGKNNADIRKQHIRMELDEMFNEVRDLELGINWIKGYIPLLKEVIRSKQ